MMNEKYCTRLVRAAMHKLIPIFSWLVRATLATFTYSALNDLTHLILMPKLSCAYLYYSTRLVQAVHMHKLIPNFFWQVGATLATFTYLALNDLTCFILIPKLSCAYLYYIYLFLLLKSTIYECGIVVSECLGNL